MCYQNMDLEIFQDSLRIHKFQRNTADGMGLFLRKEICAMKVETRLRLLHTSRGNPMAIDLTGAEKVLAL
jgi:hypothetical protein